ncbi:MAG TPA: tetratricopeptide repeat protein [Xanthomonadales bacterium]|nr:tetratricopeptide repeat protein [Xanthomonadales bacterium]
MKIDAGWVAVSIAALCAGCSSTEPPPPKAEKIVQRDWVSQVRAEAAQVGSAVEVVPLLDPELDDLRTEARTHEQRGDAAEAAATVDRALKLHPNDPALLQWRAELALSETAWQDAERIAQRSYELGPQLGEICVRNWLTIKAARTERGDPQGAASAAAQVANCQVKPPVRM